MSEWKPKHLTFLGRLTRAVIKGGNTRILTPLYDPWGCNWRSCFRPPRIMATDITVEICWASRELCFWHCDRTLEMPKDLESRMMQERRKTTKLLCKFIIVASFSTDNGFETPLCPLSYPRSCSSHHSRISHCSRNDYFSLAAFQRWMQTLRYEVRKHSFFNRGGHNGLPKAVLEFLCTIYYAYTTTLSEKSRSIMLKVVLPWLCTHRSQMPS